MNYQPTTVMVKSSDGVWFAVATDERAIPYEKAFAASKTAAELEGHGDFLRAEDVRAFSEAAAPPELFPAVVADTEALDRVRRRWGAAGFVWGDKGRNVNQISAAEFFGKAGA